MSGWRILVIDDEASADESKGLKRSETYLLLEKEKIADRPIKVVFAESLGDAENKIRTECFQLAMIDVVLQGWHDNKGEGFERLLLEARKRMSVAVVSSQWDGSSIGIVRRVLGNHPDCDVRLLLRWDDLETEETRNLIVFQMQNQIYKDQNYAPLQLQEPTKIRILHISDLHFGSSTKETLHNLEKKKIATTIKRHWKGGPDFIAVTGDVSNTGHPDDYALAEKWLEWLANEFGWRLPTKRILLIPGNHDVSIPIAVSRQIRVLGERKIAFDGDVDKDELGVSAFSWGPFQDFAEKITGGDKWRRRPFGHWVDTDYRHYGIVFSGVNTCSEVDENGWPTRKIGKSALEAIGKKIAGVVHSSPEDNILSIILAHHSPVMYDIDQPIDNPQDVKECLIEIDELEEKERPSLLILHGHAHKRTSYLCDGQTLVVCAPTPSPRPGREQDNARGFTLIELPRNEHGVKGAKVFSYIVDGGKFIITPELNYSCNKGQWMKKIQK